MSRSSDAECLKVKAFYAAFAGAFLVGLWLLCSEQMLLYASGVLCNSSGIDLSRDDSIASPIDDEPPMPTIRTVQEFDAAIARDHCVLFIDVDWSFESVAVRRWLYPWLRRFTWGDPASKIPFYRIDATQQRGDVFDKLCSGPLRDLAYGGYGPLIFVSNGQIVDVVESPSQETARSLADRIEQFARQ
jgi:hypothetical protein